MLSLSRSFVLLGALIVSASAYAERPLLWLDEGVNLNGRQFEIAPVTEVDRQADDTGATSSLQQKLTEHLAVLGVLASAARADGNRVIVVCRVMKYAGGSVAGRWVGGGLGAAYIIVRVMLLDGGSHALLGDMVSVQEIAGGGLFSIGAEKTVVSNAAEEIANAIAQRQKAAR